MMPSKKVDPRRGPAKPRYFPTRLWPVEVPTEFSSVPNTGMPADEPCSFEPGFSASMPVPDTQTVLKPSLDALLRNSLRLVRVENLETLLRYKKGLCTLLALCAGKLLDDEHPSIEQLFENLKHTLPHLWLVVSVPSKRQRVRPDWLDEAMTVWVASSLTDMVAGKEAYLHGISHPTMRRSPWVVQAALAALDTAFEEAKVHKVKAQFEANNAGATGFCWRFGFSKEAHFKQDNRVFGKRQDVVVYSLFAQTYYKTTRRTMIDVIWT